MEKENRPCFSRILICIDVLVIAGVEILCVRLYNLSIGAAVISGVISFVAMATLIVACIRWITPKSNDRDE